ncbi:MAG: pyrroline-5-carboxylate reductase [Firmicutes bacterium]|nr:pyrroline-5-carboxylate reductase [Bacillota bacterium]
MRTGFIGVGNMGGAILTGYAASPQGQKDQIMIFDTNRELCEKRLKEVRGSMTDHVSDLVKASEVIVLGVKPQVMEDVLEEVARAYQPDKLIISMAAGISIEFIRKYLGDDAKIVRIMPNTPALVGEGMIAMCPGEGLSLKQLMAAETILKSVGKVEEVDESMLDCVIGVSGSSPAYTFMYIEALVKAAVANGMSQEQARMFAAQAVLGAAKLVMESEESLEQLRINVCSPGGTTIEAVRKLEKNGFMDDVKEAFQAAVDRSKEMTRQKKG